MSGVQYEIQYNLKFFKVAKNVETTYVTFACHLESFEIDTLTFLLAEYFNQQHLFANFEKFTFFSQYKYVIDVIKKDYESKTDSDVEVKQLFKLFIDNNFIGQVPSFQAIMKNLRGYYKPIDKIIPNLSCDICTMESIKCLKCRATYASEALTVLDSNLQEGWDIFFRPMLGVPLLFFVLFKTNMKEVDEEIYTVDNIITNILLQFFYNLLSDKATPQFWNFKKCIPLIESCREYVLGVSNESMEYLVLNLNSVTYNTKIYTPLRQFMEMSFSTRQIGKLIHKMFIGFYLRIFLEAKKRNDERAISKGAKGVEVCQPADLELRNVCRVLFKEYSHEEFERMMKKIKCIKDELFVEISNNFMVSKECVVRLFNKYDLKNDVSRLLYKTNNLF
ncbi:P48 [Diatraea saccharalis granulovirus]|uniref:p48 n=1 Tax=Diatraea saccharalis granulovirus TaxID=1675862 RepID=A0A0R7EYR9_9BBAC|nr:P48 [Diatraea saccharalis granulovirus]AKN80734.1 P48 [Diatraea saccharalis granulovirus]